MTSILGISAFYHDSAAALVVDGRIVAAAQEERYSRVKHDHRFPVHAIAHCLEAGGLTAEQLDYVGFYDKPLLKFDRLLETYLAFAPAGFRSFVMAMPLWLKQKLHLPREMRKALPGYRRRFIFAGHHESHAASAFFPSPFEEAAILTLDGVGEWATGTLGTGRGNRIELTHEMRFPHSLGLLYSAFTYYCGFTVNSGEYKLMGLAPYGEPRYVDLILRHLIDLKDDGSFRMDLSYFNYCAGLTMTSKKFHRLLGGPPRKPDSRIEDRYMDVAASIQKVTEEIMLRTARHLHALTGLDNLCMAGGVALNCVGNGRVLREGPFRDIWIQPAAGDAGGALGVALLTWHQLLDNRRVPQPGDAQRGSLLGSEYGDDDVRAFLDSVGAEYEHLDDDDVLCERVAAAIAGGKVVGWFQGRMEFGPRALGARSILGDARDPRMQSVINLKVKFREGFRPFAPLVLAEHAHEYFAMEPGRESPYMLLVAPVRPDRRLPIPADLAGARGIDRLRQHRSVVPAITHVDYSARIQTVDPERNALLYMLMRKYHARTGCPVMVNTSFNLGWEPIVCAPREAYETFMSCDIDMLVLGRVVLTKEAQRATVRAAAENTSDEVLDGRLASPCCRAALVGENGTMACGSCGGRFPVVDGIPRLLWPADAAAPRGAPAAGYGDHDSVRSLIEKARRRPEARRLDRGIPYNTTVLEVGCGTGHLANFLGVGCRQVIGTDVNLDLLRQGEAFRREHGTPRVRFVQMNPLRPAVRPQQFDVVIASGLEPLAADPVEGIRTLAGLLRPGGHVIVTGAPALGRIGRVLRWFDAAGIRAVRGIPSLRPRPGARDGGLFEAQPRGGGLDHFVVEATQILAGRGGRIMLIGRKAPEGTAAPAEPEGAGARTRLAGPQSIRGSARGPD
jgi:carbamoyltransferase